MDKPGLTLPVILIGGSKFNKASLFSYLSNLRDLTIAPDYSASATPTHADDAAHATP